MDEQLYEELTDLVTKGLKDDFKEVFYKLDENVRAEFIRRTRMDKELSTPYDGKPRCADGQLGKFCLVEYDNVEREFDTLTALFATSEYLYDRLRVARKADPNKYPGAEEFLNSVFSFTHSAHLDSIYDIFIKGFNAEKSKMMETVSDSQLNPAYIHTPTVVEYQRFADIVYGEKTIASCDFLDADEETSHQRYCNIVMNISREDFIALKGENHKFIVSKAVNPTVKDNLKLIPLPSYWQYRNVLNFYNAKLEELRYLTSFIIGRKPEREMLLHVHGIFNNTDDIENYRIKKASNIHGKATVCPIGYSALADDFRANKEGITVYNPADPEIEIMMQGKHNIRRVEAEAIKARSMKNINDRVNPETAKKMRDWRSKKEHLNKNKSKILSKITTDDNTMEADAKIENAITAIDKKIHDVLSVLDDDEVVFESFNVKDGKLERGEDYVMKVE
jgi:hypothetical protein